MNKMFFQVINPTLFPTWVFRGLTRIIAGFVGDLRCVRRNTLAGAFGIYCGLLSVVSTLFTTFEVLVVYCALFGIGAGFYVGLQGACIYDVVGLKNIARGYSIMLSAFGLSCLISITAAGNRAFFLFKNTLMRLLLYFFEFIKIPNKGIES